LREQLPALESLELRVTHRFSPELDTFLGGARKVAASDELSGVEKQTQLGDQIRDSATEFRRDLNAIAASLAEKQNVLVLSRTRREVVQASSFFLSNGVAHRLRMGGMPDCIQPWIARVFDDFSETTIDEPLFKRRFATACEPVFPHEPASERAWAVLRRLASAKKGAVDVRRLRTLLSRTRPPVEACFLDGSPVGPILGTVHASKGREADEVYLLLPPVTERGDPEEESRVLYVAATRARTRLHAADAFKAWGKRLEESGRCFVLDKGRGSPQNPASARLEVGLDRDQHEAMTVSNRLMADPAAVRSAQDLLWRNRVAVRRLTAERTARGSEYRLAFEDETQELMIGSLSSNVLSDARLVAEQAGNGWPDRRLYFVFSVGARTAVISPDSRELEHVHEPYSRSGFHLVPIVRGYCRTYIKYPGGYR
jgi:hypothetical protein